MFCLSFVSAFLASGSLQKKKTMRKRSHSLHEKTQVKLLPVKQDVRFSIWLSLVVVLEADVDGVDDGAKPLGNVIGCGPERQTSHSDNVFGSSSSATPTVSSSAPAGGCSKGSATAAATAIRAAGEGTACSETTAESRVAATTSTIAAAATIIGKAYRVGDIKCH
jgi:hypothetical protein